MMKRFRHSVVDCEHEGDIRNDVDMLLECGADRIVSTDWSGEDGDSATIVFEIDESKIESFKKKMSEY